MNNLLQVMQVSMAELGYELVLLDHSPIWLLVAKRKSP